MNTWRNLFPLHTAAWQAAYASIDEMVNAPRRAEQGHLVRRWRESMLAQLSHIGIIVSQSWSAPEHALGTKRAHCLQIKGSIMSAIAVGSFSWPALSTMSVVPLTMIRIAWYNSLLLGVVAVAVGMQQSVFLVRIQHASSSDILLCELLSSQSSTGRRIPLWDQLFVWQSAVGLLEWCIYFWLGGFAVFLWDTTRVLGDGQGKQDQVVSLQ